MSRSGLGNVLEKMVRIAFELQGHLLAIGSNFGIEGGELLLQVPDEPRCIIHVVQRRIHRRNRQARKKKRPHREAMEGMT